MIDFSGALKFYVTANAAVANSSFANEQEWQRTISLDKLTESEFLREAAWVILCGGFSERIVRRYFSFISLAFCDWESAKEIVVRRDFCVAAAYKQFRNLRKLTAIADVAKIVAERGFAEFKSLLAAEPIRELRKLPFIGDVTSWHLAKNIGCDVAKPDRHLQRIAKAFGFENAHDLCHWIASECGGEVRVIDITLWRYMTMAAHESGLEITRRHLHFGMA